MNLHGIAGPYIAAVNRVVDAQWQRSTGYTTGADGKRTPAYAPAKLIKVQMQPLAYKDLIQIDGLNINGEKRVMYANHRIEGVLRSDGQGGDLITLENSSVWLVIHLLENFHYTSGWCKIAVVRQMEI